MFAEQTSTLSDVPAQNEQSAASPTAQKQAWETPDLRILETEETLSSGNKFLVEIISPPYHPS